MVHVKRYRKKITHWKQGRISPVLTISAQFDRERCAKRQPQFFFENWFAQGLHPQSHISRRFGSIMRPNHARTMRPFTLFEQRKSWNPPHASAPAHLYALSLQLNLWNLTDSFARGGLTNTKLQIRGTDDTKTPSVDFWGKLAHWFFFKSTTGERKSENFFLIFFSGSEGLAPSLNQISAIRILDCPIFPGQIRARRWMRYGLNQIWLLTLTEKLFRPLLERQESKLLESAKSPINDDKQRTPRKIFVDKKRPPF